MKICLAASGGGHMRQLLDLEPFWGGRDYVFVTEPTAMGESIAQRHATEFVPHVALGQAKLGHPLVMLRSAIANFVASWRIVAKHRPDIVISTGAGSMFFTGLFAKLRGARLVVIDSFARFEGPSGFARIAGPIADWRIAQSPAAAKAWRDAECHDPLVMLEGERPAKEALLFATVGATLPYQRLLEYVGDAKRRGLIPERLIVQTGRPEGGGATPVVHGAECVETLDFEEMRVILARADIVVCHGGTGSIITALQAGCRTIAIPRLFERGEHYDNHQLEITEAFEKRGLLFVARNREEFFAALEKARAATPRLASTDPQALIARLTGIVDGLAGREGASMTAAPAMGVAIVTFNSADVIVGCLDSLFASHGVTLRVVVTDNASGDDTAALVRDWAGRRAAVDADFAFAEIRADDNAPLSATLTLLHSDFNGGYAHGVNAGLRLLLRSEALALFWVLNPDCEVAPDAAARYAARGADGGFALMGGRTIYREAPGLIQTDGGKVDRLTGICRSVNARCAPENAEMPDAAAIDYITGANLVASRGFIERAGLMTEDYFLYYEEVDWAFRRGKLPLRLAPDAVVYHHGGTSIGSGTASRRASPFAWYFNTRNRIRFLRRHRPLAVPLGMAHAFAKAGQLLARGEMAEARAVLTGVLSLPPPRDVRARIAPGRAQALAFGRSG